MGEPRIPASNGGILAAQLALDACEACVVA